MDRPGRPKRIVRVCWERLAEAPMKMVFNSHLRRSFNHISEVVGSVKSEWAMFHAAIVRRLLEAVIAKSLVLLMAVTTPDGGLHK